MRRPLVADRQLALYGGLACFALSALLLRDAWEARGIKRPWPMKLAGLVA